VTVAPTTAGIARVVLERASSKLFGTKDLFDIKRREPESVSSVAVEDYKLKNMMNGL
jgi:hypothetical protein